MAIPERLVPITLTGTSLNHLYPDLSSLVLGNGVGEYRWLSEPSNIKLYRPARSWYYEF